MLTDLCQELHNWFDVARYTGSYTIEGGNITAPFLQEGQYFRIVGSTFNDGVYQYPAWDLTDETFDGAVWALAIPRAVVKLADDIGAWREKYEAPDSAALSPFNSESFGGYSYSKGNANGSQSGSVSGWRTAFSSQLNRWRKI